MTPETVRPALRRGRRPGGAAGPSIPVGTPAGWRANAASFALTLVSGLAQGWALISAGRGLGALLPGAAPDAWRHHLASAAAAAVVAGAGQLAAEAVARAGAAQQEGAIRARLLDHIFALGPARAARGRSGASVSLLTDGAERVALYRQTFLAPTVAACLSPALVLVLLAAAVDWVPAAVLAVAVVLVPGTIIALHSKMRRSSARSRAQRFRLAAEYLDAIQGLTTLTLARAARRRAADLRRAGEDNRRAVMGLLAGNQFVILVTDCLFSLFFVTAAVGMALSRLASGAIGVGDALAIALVSYVLLEPLDHVGAFFYIGMGGMANQRVMRRLLAAERPGGAAPDDGLPVSDGADDGGPALALKGVTASWADGGSGGAPVRQRAGSGRGGAGGAHPGGVAHPGGRPHGPTGPGPAGSGPGSSGPDRAAQPAGASGAVLTGVDLIVEAGEHVAVVGPSGAGKSTLVALAGGDLLPAAGTVRVAGTASTAETQEAVRAASAVVAQTTWLFTGTIADNLRLADPAATDERLWQALQAANLAEEVRRMPEGLGTRLGEQGLGLSGGQAQRVSLARAFLADRPLLILDEPTSQVDLDSEAQIVEAIDRLSHGRTVLTVSHRAGALTASDRVVRVADGRVREAGPSVPGGGSARGPARGSDGGSDGPSAGGASDSAPSESAQAAVSSGSAQTPVSSGSAQTPVSSGSAQTPVTNTTKEA
ncbi:ABC transporter ATP-binding protein [Actinomyces israelii]|uniref:ABC transporter ATP-binding protein n=1 Tax=Actinomyces israelii TaxID=1659 RepID=A0ABT4IBH0_9ACTO|nr:ABC transporter ATP-binding protein [Actinomyces israelii]MCZ0859094.1 ABC transporter ATP-binding protein [Actinomyces israelii]